MNPCIVQGPSMRFLDLQHQNMKNGTVGSNAYCFSAWATKCNSMKLRSWEGYPLTGSSKQSPHRLWICGILALLQMPHSVFTMTFLSASLALWTLFTLEYKIPVLLNQCHGNNLPLSSVKTLLPKVTFWILIFRVLHNHNSKLYEVELMMFLQLAFWFVMCLSYSFQISGVFPKISP